MTTEPDTEAPVPEKALIWPDLLYAMSMVAGKGDPPKGQIWVEVVDENTLRLAATDGVLMLLAKIPTTHSRKGGVYRLSPEDFKKKPAQSQRAHQVLCAPERWADVMPFDLKLVQTRCELDSPPAKASLDPERAAKFFKAVSVICSRVDLTTFGKATYLSCPHPDFDGEVRALISNLYVHK